MAIITRCRMPAGELVRVLARALARAPGCRRASSILDGALPRASARRARVVQAHGLGDLVADGEDRVEAVIGSWKIMAMRLPRTPRMSRSSSASRSRAVEPMRLPDSMRPGRRDEAHDATAR